MTTKNLRPYAFTKVRLKILRKCFFFCSISFMSGYSVKFIPLGAKRVMEVANLTEIKNPHTPLLYYIEDPNTGLVQYLRQKV